MKRTAVFVATTGGPVRIERITRERAPQSMVCLKRTSTILPISDAYDNFVRPGSGVIERCFGPAEDGAFRLDVSAMIDTGLSWQLGFFVAHALAEADRALCTEEEAETIIWLTGSVDCDLAVGSVGHIAEKVHASSAALAAWSAAGKDVVMIVRAGQDFDEASAAGVPEGVKLVSVTSAGEALAAVGLPRRDQRVQLPAIWKPMRRVMNPRVAVAFGALVAAFLLASEWQAWRTQAPIDAVEPPPIAAAAIESAPPAVAPAVTPAQTRMALVERRAPPGSTCAQVQFGRVGAVETLVPVGAEGLSKLQDLCGLGLVVDNAGQERFVTVLVDVPSGKLLYGTERPAAFEGRAAFRNRQQWVIDLPLRMEQPFEIRAVAVSADRPTSEAAAQLDAKDPEAAARALGFAVARVHHRVIP